MAASKSELWDQLAKAIKIFDELWKFAATNTINIVSLIDTLSQAYRGNHVSDTSSNLATFRNAISSQTVNTAALEALIIELAKNGYDSIATSVSAALDDIKQGMVDGSETVSERNITFGSSIAGGSNVGNGICLRLTTDKDGFKIEDGAWNGGVTKAEITRDKNTGTTANAERVFIYGVGKTPIDNIEQGDAPNGTLTTTAIDNSNGILLNGGFETSEGAGATLEFSGWTLSSADDFLEETTTTFGGSGQAINFTTNANILQYLPDAGAVDEALPTFLIVPFYREFSCDGTLTIRLGSQTESVVLSAQTGWNFLYLGVDDEKGWYENWKEDSGGNGARVQITLSGRTTGNLLVDNVVLAQPQAYNSKYYMVIAGDSNFINGDYFTFTDSVNGSEGGDGRIQFTLSRLFGKYLPHTSGTPTYADA